MTPPRTKPAANTSKQILDLAENLIQTLGYSAFSYQDLSAALGITKPSIHYHFPSKAELGTAVIERYAARFREALAAIEQQQSISSMAMLERYFEPFLQFSKTPNKVCLCGALAGEMMALPPRMHDRADRFFKDHQAWLASILKRGAERGEFRMSAPVAKTARMIFSALQGALLVKRTTGDASEVRDVVAAIKSQLAVG